MSNLSIRWVSAAATLAMGAAMLVSRIAVGALLPPEMLFNFTSRLLGVPWVFNLIHSLPFGADRFAKFALFGLTIAIYLAAWFVLGLFAPALVRRFGKVATAIAAGATSTALVGFVLLPIQGLGLFGASASNFLYPPLASSLWAAGFGLLFGVVVVSLLSSEQHSDPARREAVTMVARSLAVLAFGAAFGRLLAGAWSRAQELASFLGSLVGLSPEITPTDDHYVISKNVFNPSVREDGWELTITGMVDNAITFTLADLKALPTVERSSTLTCISNRVGGDLIGNSVWTGVRLADLLAVAGVQEGADELILRAADNYSDSFPLEAAQREGTIVAYLQNGETLTRDHGFPARVLVPGIYGMKNVKWVVEIELANQDYLGYWQTRGWSDVAEVRTMSRIDTAVATRLPDGNYGIGGVAFAGLRGIQQIEVSLDNGATWLAAELDPAENGLSWNLWGFSWDASPGTYEVLVRATDGTGVVQPAERARPLPDGSSGHHSVRVRVE